MISDKFYQVCTCCVMDTSAKDIIFNKQGVCNYCSVFSERYKRIQTTSSNQNQTLLKAFIDKVKSAGKHKKYDCIIGVSGGVDSSWALVQAVHQGLRPLAVHMDNGWNSELAQNNIANLVRNLNVDLYTHVINWDEYKKLMQAFFDADVIDVELLYDNAMLAVNYQQAAKHGIKYILAGTNQATEGMRMPTEWNWFKYDKRNIQALAKRFSNIKLKTFPSISTLDFVWHKFVMGRKWISFLDYFNYQKKQALDELSANYGYKPYIYKHYESIFTRFYQGYILPRKFSVDKRRLHFSNLILSGQANREEVLKQLENIPYPSEIALEEDKFYFIKKMGWTMDQLNYYITRPEISHDFYKSEKYFWNLCFNAKKNLAKALKRF